MRRVLLISHFSFLILFLLPMGCSSGDKPPSVHDRSQEALRDPFGYSPQFDETNITGGGTWELDREGLRKDIDRVFNP